MNETPTPPPDQGPEHWADLCENDVIQDGDEWELDGLWHPAEAIGCRVGDIGNRYRRRVAPEPTAEQARNIEGDFEEPEYTRLKAQKDAIVERENERLRGLAKERDAALARIAELERERDEARAERDTVSRQISQIGELLKGEELTKEQVNETGLGEWVLIEQRHAVAKLRAQLAESEKDLEVATELLAIEMYNDMRRDDEEGARFPWVPKGNSLKQEEARHKARAAIAAMKEAK